MTNGNNYLRNSDLRYDLAGVAKIDDFCTHDKRHKLIYFCSTTSLPQNVMQKHGIYSVGCKDDTTGQMFILPENFITEKGHPIGSDLTIVLSSEIAKLASSAKREKRK